MSSLIPIIDRSNLGMGAGASVGDAEEGGDPMILGAVQSLKMRSKCVIPASMKGLGLGSCGGRRLLR